MATDFKVIAKNKEGVGHVVTPYAVKVEQTTNSYTIYYYEDADHTGTLKNTTRSKLVFDVFAVPKQ